MGFFVSAFLIPYRSLSKIATPIVPRLWKENKMAELQKLYVQFSLTNFFVAGTIFLFILINMDLLFLYLPDSFEIGIYVFVGIGLARLFEVMYGLNEVILISSSRYKMDLFFCSFFDCSYDHYQFYFHSKMGNVWSCCGFFFVNCANKFEPRNLYKS